MILDIKKLLLRIMQKLVECDAAIEGLEHTQKTLWSGAMSMRDSHVINLSESISAQKHGIVLVWSDYDIDNSEARNARFVSHFISKRQITEFGGNTCSFIIANYSSIYFKALYINNNSITGASYNASSSFSLQGHTVDNRKVVLRRVYGV